MKIIALGSDKSGTLPDDFIKHLDAEAMRVWELTQEGIIQQIFFRADRRDAVIFLECESLESAQTVLQSLPLVEKNLIGFELIPLKPYDGFKRLFKTTN
jgi:hypothetical protein